MKNEEYRVVGFPDFRCAYFKQNLKNYTFFFVGENLSQSSIERDLKPLQNNLNSEDWKDFFAKAGIVSVGYIERKRLAALQDEVRIIQQKINLRESHLAILIEYQNPNLPPDPENLPSEESFIISPDDFFRYYETGITTGLCYHFLLKASEDKSELQQIIAHQTGHPHPQNVNAAKPSKSTEVIMPHRGNTDDLETALWYLKNQRIQPRKVSVCFDETVTEHHFDLADDNPDARFFFNHPAGAGPYPCRDILARASEEEVIVFHDSDDISTSDRTSVLTDFLTENDLDAVGSHELRIDKIEKRVVAVRFPLRVIEETSRGQYSIFFPATAITKSAYLKTGGLSTVRKHSSDSQFYKRAYFLLNIKNVDEFLYIRVKRADSLTTNKNTALSSPIRERLRAQWNNDFIRVQNQNINLLDSTLIDEYNNVNVEVIPLSEKHRRAILDWQKLNDFLQKESLTHQVDKREFPNKKDILEERLSDFKLIKEPGVYVLKQSLSWRIGWAVTRAIVFLFGWIPAVKKRL